MAFKNSPLNYTSLDLELEAIKRFRDLAPVLNGKCRVFRQLNGSSVELCLDFIACPQEIEMNQEEWQEFALFLVHSSHYLGLANSLVFKIGDHIVSQMIYK